MSLSVSIRGNKNLLEALDIKEELLSDDNMYFCEKCQRKVDAISRTCLKNLPPVLLIQLKRFDFDWDRNRPVKLHDHFSFPSKLDMGPYTVDALAKRDQATKLAERTSSVEITDIIGDEDTGRTSEVADVPTSSVAAARDLSESLYQLSGVVVHKGAANVGHYYSFIKIRDPASPLYEKWLKFNDEQVEVVQLSDDFMEREFFGGNGNEALNYHGENDRNWSAYILVYERVVNHGADNCFSKISEQASLSVLPRYIIIT
jgi:ubiquitin carboxyl-terminal hydrolase 9/24